jgi:PD-(D/E)XK nuclease superfamily
VTRLLADIVSLTPSTYEDFTRCPRLFLNGSVLGVPPSDPAPSADQGLLVHDMLHRIHTTGSCHDDAHVRDVLDAHGASARHVLDLVARHRARCPQGADGEAHEHELARFHRQPPPMFMATARIDALWVHDGVLDARDYKTGGRFADRVADIPAARVQAYVLAATAAGRGLRLQLRYEYLQAEITEDPETWEPDEDDLATLEEDLRATVAEMWAHAADASWTGVADPALCGTCRYRSICRDSATLGEPAWPVLAAGSDDLNN